jgi:hypothetical protein
MDRHPRTANREPRLQCAGIWDWCDGQSTNCDYAPIDNAWYFWAVNSTARLARAVNATRGGGEVTAVQLAALDQVLRWPAMDAALHCTTFRHAN